MQQRIHMRWFSHNDHSTILCKACLLCRLSEVSIFDFAHQTVFTHVATTLLYLFRHGLYFITKRLYIVLIYSGFSAAAQEYVSYLYDSSGNLVLQTNMFVQ